VPAADVIVTNPSHFAVALAYKSGMGAPKLLAKGWASGAQNPPDRRRKWRADVEAPPLARALYRHAELDQEIPAALYAAVAEVLAYVYQLSNWRQVGGSLSAAAARNSVPADLVRGGGEWLTRRHRAAESLRPRRAAAAGRAAADPGSSCR
jgi:flagellar biosynthetic protein FlhB